MTEKPYLAGYFFGRDGRRTHRRFDAVGVELKGDEDLRHADLAGEPIDDHRDAFEAIGGVPELVVPPSPA